jgi:hypothetical protein
MNMDGSVEKRPQQLDLKATEWQAQIEAHRARITRFDDAIAALKTTKDVPFVWDIAFVEVFEGERGGFDIVFGNPPYVGRDNIAAPEVCGARATDDKREYKAKLAHSVYQAWPSFFRYDHANPKRLRKLDAQSDLYIYFYFHGLSLLNPMGSFCFVTSNSWLDVGYGKDLQEFLLKYSHVKLVLDNQVKRTFASADVNTVIVLLAAPSSEGLTGLERVARFAMFKVPFEHIISPAVFDEVEAATTRTTTQEYRVNPVQQSVLLEDGMESPDREEEERKPTGPLIKVARYVGGKWGGEYLRAPDIYFSVLSKGGSALGRLSAYLDGERYLNTGGADGFFIISDAKESRRGTFHVVNGDFEGDIESIFLRPLVKDATKADRRPEIRRADAHCLVVDDRPTPALRRYIKWGEAQGFHQRSVTKSQHPWYRPTRQMLSAAPILVPRSFNDSFAIFYNPKKYLSLRYYRLHPKKTREEEMVGFLNSTLVALWVEVLGNKSLGQGALDFFMADFLAMDVPIVLNSDIAKAFQALKNRPIGSVFEESGLPDALPAKSMPHPKPDRAELDGLVFDALRLSQGERSAVYEALVDLVRARLEKARSFRPSKPCAVKDEDEDAE